MPRRRKTSPAEDFVDLLAWLPWWLCLVVAAVSYFLLHAHATSALPPVPTAGPTADLLTGTVTRGLAMVGQYLIPGLAVVAGGVSAFRRRQRAQLLDRATAGAAADVLNEMSWREFELLIGEAFRRQGFQVTESGQGGADGGVDLVLRKGGETHLVQCKQWRAFRVGVQTVRELYGVMAAQGAAGGYVVTSGRFTDEARAFAHGRNVRLLDGDQVKSMIGNRKAVGPAASPAAAGNAPSAAAASTPASAPPPCPRCGSTMALRKARHGAKAGTGFWGCAAYPQCRGTRPLP